MARRGQKRNRGGFRAWLALWRTRLLVLAALGTVGLSAWAYLALRDLPDVKSAREGSLVLERPKADGVGVIYVRVTRKSPRWVPLTRISPYLTEAVITAEDDLFYEHEGFNVQAIKESAEKNLKTGHFARGGSTITQQLAKNLFLTQKKTLTRKLQEAYLAYWIEVKFTKDEILEHYLNIAEWGPDLYGIGPAARHYFGKSASDLTALEGAFLANLLPSPKKRHAWAAGGMTDAARRLQRSLLERMHQRHVLTDEEYGEALNGRLRFRPGLAASKTPGD